MSIDYFRINKGLVCVHRVQHSPRLKHLPVVFAPTGRTKSEFKDSCDINHILKNYLSNGVTTVMKGTPTYGDFSNPIDYREAQDLIIQANNQFEALPSDIRARFHNDPATFLKFAENPANHDEMVKMGLASPKEAPPLPEDTSSTPPSSGGDSEASPSPSEAAPAAEGGTPAE